MGDFVEIEVDQFEADKAYIVEVLARKNQLLRPAVANIEQSVIVMAIKQPNPNFLLLDKMLVMSEVAGVKPIIVFNKADLSDIELILEYRQIYQASGYQLLVTSFLKDENIDKLEALLKDKVSAFSGPSGVGKSSLLNRLVIGADLKTGEISPKIGRGKHTTRHSELLKLKIGGYVLDTAGFTSLDVEGIEAEELATYFPEFKLYSDDCQFRDCLHQNENNCAVKTALENGRISNSRYHSYLMILKELKERRAY